MPYNSLLAALAIVLLIFLFIILTTLRKRLTKGIKSLPDLPG